MKIFLSLVVLVVVVGGAVYFWKQSKTDSKPASTNSTQNNSSGNNSKPTTPNPTPSGTDIGSEVMNGGIEGKLYESDNKSRGNLMLVKLMWSPGLGKSIATRKKMSQNF
jgi:hypothetical protein